KLGLSKAEAGAPFVHLAPELKRQLYQRMGEIGADYDMGDAAQRGFVRHYGWRKSSVSGADMVQALMALAKESFYAAYDALAQFPVLSRGLHSAMDQQRRVVGQGVTMLERQAVKTLRSFRLAMVTEPEFGCAFALRQLALFLMQTLRERSKPVHARLPFVVAAPLPDPERLLVLGITPMGAPLVGPRLRAPFNASQYAGESRNQFGLVFEAVAADLGADVRQGFFDSAALEIRREDMSAFVDKLRRHL
ncbi:DNA replication initiation factor cdc45, partial [Coemansia furcata]